MTKQESTTPRSTRTIVTANPKPTITIKHDGELRCNCSDFRLSAAVFGEGSCTHTRMANIARAAQGGK